MALGPPEASRRELFTSPGNAGTGITLTAVRSHAQGEKAKPKKYYGMKLLEAPERHLVSRFSFGITPQLASQVRTEGGARAWWDRQLEPAGIADQFADQLLGWWPSLSMSPQELWAMEKAGMMRGWGVCQDYLSYVLLRRIFTTHQVQEVMTEFWETHLDVPLNGEPSFLFRRAYGDTLRANAFGRYEDILFAAVTHPAMLVHLDNTSSTVRHPNEDLGRELLEVHSVGIGNFDEDDVNEAAKILTGWRVDTHQGNSSPTWVASYNPGDHWVGPVRVMDFTDANDSPHGREVTRRLVRHLAHHPATARRMARKLAVKFVSDDPPNALVDKLAQVYLTNDTAMVPVLRALTASPQFFASRTKKVRDATEDVVATWRALGAQVRPPTSAASAANALPWQAGNPAMMPLDMHHSMSGGWPDDAEGMVFRRPQQWVPELPIRLDQLVDHLSQQLTHQHAPTGLVGAACASVGYPLDTTITQGHPVVRAGIPSLLTTILDSPGFSHR